MGVKEGGAPPMTVEQIMEMVDEGRKIEQNKLYHEAHPFKMRPAYNHHAKEHLAFAPWYPEMNEVGYDHKVHGTQVVPDYRVYNVARTAAVSPQINAYVNRLSEAGLQDPWLRNELWRTDPYCGNNTRKANIISFFKKGLMIGAGLAVTHFIIRKAVDALFPPAHKETDKWWECRETPEPNEIFNRIKPIEYIYGMPISRNPKFLRPISEDFGVERKPVKQWYKRENDPALIGCE